MASDWGALTHNIPGRAASCSVMRGLRPPFFHQIARFGWRLQLIFDIGQLAYDLAP
jgi:hypothetical protein